MIVDLISTLPLSQVIELVKILVTTINIRKAKIILNTQFCISIHIIVNSTKYIISCHLVYHFTPPLTSDC